MPSLPAVDLLMHRVQRKRLSPLSNLKIVQPATAKQTTLSTITSGSEFQALFQSHENWLQNIKGRQEEAFDVLNKSLNALGERMANAHEKSSEVVRRLTALDGLIDEERRKWKERLEMEKREMSERVQAMYDD